MEEAIQNSITITGKKKSSDKLTEINYSYKIYFDSKDETKAYADLKLAEALVDGRTKTTTAQLNAPTSPRCDAI